MGAVKEFVIRIMNGGNDALVAASEWSAEEHCHAVAAAERLRLVVDCPDDEPLTVTRIVDAMEKEIEQLRAALLGMMQRCRFHDGEQKTDSGLGAYLKAKSVLEGKHS